MNCRHRLRSGWPLGRVIAVAFVRHRDETPYHVYRSLSPSTGQSIRTYAEKNGIDYRSITLSCGKNGLEVNLHVLTLKPPHGESDTTFFYIHGGGYFNPINSAAQVPFALDCARRSTSGTCIFLEYTLAPELKYPGQLIQAIRALSYLLETRQLSSILLGADSVGGNMAMALLMHLKQPSPYANALNLRPGDRLKGLLLVSPWVSFDFETASYHENERFDMISRDIMTRIVGWWAPKAGEPWAEPAAAPSALLQELPVQRLLLLAGGWECYRDGILLLAEKLGAAEFGSGSPFEYLVAPRETHDQCILDMPLQLKSSAMYLTAMQWLSRLTNSTE